MKKVLNYTIVWLPPVLLLAAFILRRYIYALVSVISASVTMCTFYKLTGILCPGCGGTRSFIAFTKGDILLSLRCNPAVLFGLILLILLYIELSAKKLGKRITLFPMSKKFWTVTGVIFSIWCILRNFVPVLMPPV